MPIAVKNPDLLSLDLPAIIVFGRDGAKARASWFPADQASQAAEAAVLMEMNALPVSNDDLRQLATKMPKGRLFDSGKAFVPFVQAKVCEALTAQLPADQPVKLRLVASAGGAKPTESAPAKPEKVIATHHPRDWSDITLGSLVLAQEAKGEGWYESVVQEAKENDVFVLRWRDYPEEPNFVRHRSNLALLFVHPNGDVAA